MQFNVENECVNRMWQLGFITGCDSKSNNYLFCFLLSSVR